jgi:hypothetical protein
LKKSFVSAPILHHFDGERKIVVETDASNLVIAGALSQYDNNDILHPVAHLSRKHFPAEINYEIYDKEFLAIVWAFKEWRPLLEGSPHTIKVISDYRNLTYFTTNLLLNYRQTRWSEFLSHFDFKINHRLRKEHGKANTLTCLGQESDKDSDLQEVYRTQTLLKSPDLGFLAYISPPTGGPTFYDLLHTTYETDTFPSEILQCFRMKHVTPNELAWGNVKNEMNDFTIAESFSSQIILHFVFTSYRNTRTPQSQATVVKLKPLRLLPNNLSGLECAKT